MKGRIACYIAATFIFTLSIAFGIFAVVKLFMPTPAEILTALTPSIILIVICIVLVLLGTIPPKLIAKRNLNNLSKDADATVTAVYGYMDAKEALSKRCDVWRNTTWTDERRRLDAIREIHDIMIDLTDLDKMSMWFLISFNGILYQAARDAVSKVDADRLKMLSGFISYCASTTEFETSNEHFAKACQNVQKKIHTTLELYANMRTKLSSFEGDDSEVSILQSEIFDLINNL